jgi:glycerophosphoryl diester phosphodiesterase
MDNEQVIPGSQEVPLLERRPLVIAHRGASRQAPENTLAAFAAAIDAGCDAVELDVRRTADGVLVAHHAAARRGTPLGRLTYEQLKALTRHQPPTLSQTVTLCEGRIGLDVELKEEGTEKPALALLAQRFPRSRLLITSFHETVIATVKRLDGTLPCGLLVAPRHLVRRRQRPAEGHPLERAARCGADVLLPHQLLVKRQPRQRAPHGDILQSAANSGMPVIVWTVNGSRRLARYIEDPRVAGVITDLPDVAESLKRRLGAPDGISRN